MHRNDGDVVDCYVHEAVIELNSKPVVLLGGIGVTVGVLLAASAVVPEVMLASLGIFGLVGSLVYSSPSTSDDIEDALEYRNIVNFSQSKR